VFDEKQNYGETDTREDDHDGGGEDEDGDEDATGFEGSGTWTNGAMSWWEEGG
jgi:hypothetical protein